MGTDVLQAAENLYLTVFENTGTAVIVVEDDTTISLANSTFVEWSGFSKEEIEGKKELSEFIEKGEIEKVLNYHRLRRVEPHKAPKHYETRFVDRTGRTKDAYMTVDLVWGSDKSVLSFMDVTHLNEAEREVRQLNVDLENRVRERTAQLETVNRELEAFSYSVSHDLRTPLITIEGFSKILLKKHADRLDPDGQRLLAGIFRAAKQMGELINDLLVLSHLKKQEFKHSEVDMEELARSTFEELKAITPDRDIKLTIKDLPAVFGDPSMIHQVYVNLLSNAIKFTRKNDHASIEVGGFRRETENVYYVKDNGVGFDMADADKLFGVFQRLHSQDEFEGTGVGLAIVKRIVYREGGKVWAEGKTNLGATFFFTLPNSKERLEDS